MTFSIVPIVRCSRWRGINTCVGRRPTKRTRQQPTSNCVTRLIYRAIPSMSKNPVSSPPWGEVFTIVVGNRSTSAEIARDNIEVEINSSNYLDPLNGFWRKPETARVHFINVHYPQLSASNTGYKHFLCTLLYLLYRKIVFRCDIWNAGWIPLRLCTINLDLPVGFIFSSKINLANVLTNSIFSRKLLFKHSARDRSIHTHTHTRAASDRNRQRPEYRDYVFLLIRTMRARKTECRAWYVEYVFVLERPHCSFKHIIMLLYCTSSILYKSPLSRVQKKRVL